MSLSLQVGRQFHSMLSPSKSGIHGFDEKKKWSEADFCGQLYRCRNERQVLEICHFSLKKEKLFSSSSFFRVLPFMAQGLTVQTRLVLNS